VGEHCHKRRGRRALTGWIWSLSIHLPAVIRPRRHSGGTLKWRNQSPMIGRRFMIACSKSSRRNRQLSGLAHGVTIAAGCLSTGAAPSAPTRSPLAIFAIIRGACRAQGSSRSAAPTMRWLRHSELAWFVVRRLPEAAIHYGLRSMWRSLSGFARVLPPHGGLICLKSGA
jgi:hypothetical protein